MFSPFSISRSSQAMLLAIGLALSTQALAQGSSASSPIPPLAADQLIGPPVPGAKPKTYALVSAVGSQMQIVRQKFSTGTSIEPFDRSQVTIPNQALNNSILRGLDRAVAGVDNSAQRVLLHVNIPAFEHFHQHDRAEAAAKALIDALEKFPQRMEWDEIIAVTPRYMRASSDRMGTKLWGIGVYIQPLNANRGSLEDADLSLIDEEAKTAGVDSQISDQFVAPYAYLRFTVLDAKTLQVIRTLDRTDARKTMDKDCTTTDIFKCFNADQYAQMIDTLAERTAARGVAGTNRGGTVEMKDPKVVR